MSSAFAGCSGDAAAQSIALEPTLSIEHLRLQSFAKLIRSRRKSADDALHARQHSRAISEGWAPARVGKKDSLEARESG